MKMKKALAFEEESDEGEKRLNDDYSFLPRRQGGTKRNSLLTNPRFCCYFEVERETETRVSSNKRTY